MRYMAYGIPEEKVPKLGVILIFSTPRHPECLENKVISFTGVISGPFLLDRRTSSVEAEVPGLRTLLGMEVRNCDILLWIRKNRCIRRTYKELGLFLSSLLVPDSLAGWIDFKSVMVSLGSISAFIVWWSIASGVAVISWNTIFLSLSLRWRHCDGNIERTCAVSGKFEFGISQMNRLSANCTPRVWLMECSPISPRVLFPSYNLAQFTPNFLLKLFDFS